MTKLAAAGRASLAGPVEHPKLPRDILAGAMVTSVLLFAAPIATQAQDAGLGLWNDAGCFACHGDVAAGGGDPANPAGPSLRRRIEPEVLLEAVACGRPSTEMPSFLIDAYKHPICSETPLDAPPEDVTALDLFTEDEVRVLVAWLQENVVGKSRITRENCAVFFGGDANARACLQY